MRSALPREADGVAAGGVGRKVLLQMTQEAQAAEAAEARGAVGGAAPPGAERSGRASGRLRAPGPRSMIAAWLGQADRTSSFTPAAARRAQGGSVVAEKATAARGALSVKSTSSRETSARSEARRVPASSSRGPGHKEIGVPQRISAQIREAGRAISASLGAVDMSEDPGDAKPAGTRKRSSNHVSPPLVKPRHSTNSGRQRNSSPASLSPERPPVAARSGVQKRRKRVPSPASVSPERPPVKKRRGERSSKPVAAESAEGEASLSAPQSPPLRSRAASPPKASAGSLPLEPGNFQAMVLEQLQEICGETEDAKVLAEYVVVMVAGNKSREEMALELKPFFKDMPQSTSFVEWVEDCKWKFLTGGSAPGPGGVRSDSPGAGGMSPAQALVLDRLQKLCGENEDAKVLTEYVMAMLAGSKSREEMASELKPFFSEKMQAESFVEWVEETKWKFLTGGPCPGPRGSRIRDSQMAAHERQPLSSQLELLKEQQRQQQQQLEQLQLAQQSPTRARLTPNADHYRSERPVKGPHVAVTSRVVLQPNPDFAPSEAKSPAVSKLVRSPTKPLTPKASTPSRTLGMSPKAKQKELLESMTKQLQLVLTRLGDKTLTEDTREKYTKLAQSIQCQMAKISPKAPPRVTRMGMMRR